MADRSHEEMLELQKEASMAKLTKAQRVEMSIIHGFNEVGYHLAYFVGGLVRKFGVK